MDFEFYCWHCDAENVIRGEPAGFWVEKWRLPSEWTCWNCDALNTTPDD
ncbi:hypothetical protein [Streptomyces otsuchiensis]|nr:hypothetical protein [Streptomyces otsuchiensis]